MTKRIIVAPVGDHIEDLFVGIREFPTEKVILIAPKERYDIAQDAEEKLKMFKIPVKIIESKGHVWEETFRIVSEIRKAEPEDRLIVNVSTGDRDSRCAATSAAFVNGLKAFAVDGDNVMLLPVLKFSYYKLLTEQKMKILKILYKEKGCCSSFEELSKHAKMSLPLVSYHINGTLKSEGLKNMGLIETMEMQGRIKVQLSTLGKLLLKGYIT